MCGRWLMFSCVLSLLVMGCSNSSNKHVDLPDLAHIPITPQHDLNLVLANHSKTQWTSSDKEILWGVLERLSPTDEDGSAVIGPNLYLTASLDEHRIEFVFDRLCGMDVIDNGSIIETKWFLCSPEDRQLLRSLFYAD